MNQPIPLSQKLYVLGIHPEKGGLISASYSVMNTVLNGALFLELFLNKNIRFLLLFQKQLLQHRQLQLRLLYLLLWPEHADNTLITPH